MPLGMEEGLDPGEFVLDGDPALPPRKGGGARSPIFGLCPLWPNSRMDHDGTLHKGGPSYIVLDWDLTPLPKTGLANFRPISIVAKRLDASRCHSVWS